MEPTKQRLQASALCRFSVVLIVFSDSFPNFTRTYLLTDLQSPDNVLTVSIETVSTITLAMQSKDGRRQQQQQPHSDLRLTIFIGMQDVLIGEHYNI